VFLKKHFQDLVECQSLLNTLRGLEDLVKKAQDRMGNLEQKDRDKKAELSTQLSFIKESEALAQIKEKELHKVLQKLENLKQNTALIKNTAQEKTYLEEEAHLSQTRDRLEKESYEILESLDNFKSNIEEINEFLRNFPVTLSEIKSEVEKEIAKHQKEIESLRERIKNLLSIIPKDLAEIFRSQVKKFGRGIIFARTFNNECEACRFKVNQLQVENIHRFISLEFCASCKRLLIPEYL
jgi:predicted  nucleic acid-binding Zn-ribbon protein